MPEAGSVHRNPWTILSGYLRACGFGRLAADAAFVAELERLCADRRRVSRPRRAGSPPRTARRPSRGVAYFSMEFGLGEALPLYAGGLGVLAGDFLKTASDLGIPVIGVGLLYQEGYFRQIIDAAGMAA